MHQTIIALLLALTLSLPSPAPDRQSYDYIVYYSIKYTSIAALTHSPALLLTVESHYYGMRIIELFAKTRRFDRDRGRI